MAVSMKMSIRTASVSARSARVAVPRMLGAARPSTVVRAVPAEDTVAGVRAKPITGNTNGTIVEEDPSAKVQEQLQEAAKFVQNKWEETSDAEKPAAVAIIIGAIIAQIAIGASIDAVDRLPFIHQFLEFVGLAVTAVYGYRYVTDPAERESVQKSLESFWSAVTGK